MSRKRVNNSVTPSTSGQAENIILPPLTLAEANHLETFARYRHIYEFYKKTGEIVSFHAHIQNELLEAYRALYDKFYHYDRSCPICVAEFLSRIYAIHNKQTI
jgi:hypothetical protein